jgi:tetratricopeptide (TPR) repeat protein
MNIAKHFAAGIASVGLLGGLGCVSSGQGGERVEKVSKSDADSLDAEHSKFESNKDPEITAKTHFAAGQLAESQGALAAAIQQYRLAVRVDPHHQPSLYRLGVLYAQVRAYPEAIATWKTYVQETQEEATGYGNLGFCYELAGQ